MSLEKEELKTIRQHYMTIRVAEPKIPIAWNKGKDVEQQELPFTAENPKWYHQFGRQISFL